VKKFIKAINIFRWLEFKREAIIVFANLKRNDKAYKHLDELMKVTWIVAYVLGMLIYAGLRELICYVL